MDAIPASHAKLLKRARGGDEAAFFDLYHRYRRPVFQFAWRLTGSEAAAEDVAQECFSGSRGIGRCAGCGRGSARHRKRTTRRRRSIRWTRCWPRSARRWWGRAIASLPLLQREALLLFEYEGLSMEEIAQVAGSDAGAAKARLFRARESLRRRLAPLMAAPAARGTR